MDNVSEIYHQIGQAIIDSIEVKEWKKAKLHLEVIGSSVDFKGFLDEGKRFQAPGEYSLARSILKLHKITTEGGNNKWNRAIFTLKSDYSFDMEFIWDQELQDEIERLANA